MFTDTQIGDFVADGYLAIRQAFPSSTAAACRAIIWSALEDRGIRREDPGTWTAPSVRIACPDGEPFVEAASSPALAEAYDQLIGPHRWTRPQGIGGDLPVRFPSRDWPGDTGYHIEGNWWGGDEYWTDVGSRGRGLTAFFLLSDVGPDDAPTRLVTGSHLFLPAVLAAAGPRGMGGAAAVGRLAPSVLCRHTVHATGAAGDVYLCHPFLVHTSTWPHRGTTPRMIAQPGVDVPDGFAVDGSDRSPVAQAIVSGIPGPSSSDSSPTPRGALTPGRTTGRERCARDR